MRLIYERSMPPLAHNYRVVSMSFSQLRFGFSSNHRPLPICVPIERPVMRLLSGGMQTLGLAAPLPTAVLL